MSPTAPASNASAGPRRESQVERVGADREVGERHPPEATAAKVARRVRTMLDWWIGEDGFPIAERSRQLRWFVRIDNQLVWGGTPDEATANTGLPRSAARSLTFIPARLDDFLARHGADDDTEFEALLDRAAQLDEAMTLVDGDAPRHALALRSYYGLAGQPRCELTEIGRTLGVSSERARQICVAGEGMLRERFEARRA